MKQTNILLMFTQLAQMNIAIVANVRLRMSSRLQFECQIKPSCSIFQLPLSTDGHNINCLGLFE